MPMVISGTPIRKVVVRLIDPEGRERTATLDDAFRGPVRIGRAPENDMQVVSPYVSRRHAEIWAHPDGIHYRDLGSTSGSWYQGRRITESILKINEVLHLGSPDGIAVRVTVADPPVVSLVTGETPTSRTEVLRVADFTQSQYLGSLAEANISSITRRKAQPSRKNEERLRALIALTSDLLEVQDARSLADKVLGRCLDLLPVERGMVLLAGRNGLVPLVWGVRERGPKDISRPDAGMSDNIDVSAERGKLVHPDVPFTPISTVTDRVWQDAVGLLTLDAMADQRLEGSHSVVLQSVRSILAAPLGSAKKVHGVVYLDTHRPLRKDDEDALDWLVAAGRQAGVVMNTLELLDQQRRMLESLMKGLAASIDARDGITAGHSARVAHYSLGICKALGLGTEEEYRVYYAALLHDYGKIGIDDAVLRKPSALTPEEFEHIRKHPRFTYDILSKIEFPPQLADLPMMAASHHERMDGKGYPFGLVGDAIPLAGRIIAIADVYDALTQVRHYRNPMPMDEVLQHLEEGRGSRFDSAVLDGFMRYHREELASRMERRARKRERFQGVDDGLDESIDGALLADAGIIAPPEPPITNEEMPSAAGDTAEGKAATMPLDPPYRDRLRELAVRFGPPPATTDPGVPDVAVARVHAQTSPNAPVPRKPAAMPGEKFGRPTNAADLPEPTGLPPGRGPQDPPAGTRRF